MDHFTAVVQRDGDWWDARVRDVPGANLQGRAFDEAREDLNDAMHVLREANRILARRERGGA